jgi:hypothetical protein
LLHAVSCESATRGDRCESLDATRTTIDFISFAISHPEHPRPACIIVTRRRRNRSTLPAPANPIAAGHRLVAKLVNFRSCLLLLPLRGRSRRQRLQLLSAWTRMRAVPRLGCVKVSWMHWSKRRVASESMGSVQGRSHLRRPPMSICASNLHRSGERMKKK